MALERIDIQLAIPEDVWAIIPLARKKAFRDEIRAMRAFAVKINEGLVNEEMTVTAKRHTCHHDEPGNTILCTDTTVDI